jgi:hypothetical protein
LKQLREPFRTLTIFHARSVRVVASTWAMDHRMLDNLKQLRFFVWIRPGGTNHTVDILSIGRAKFMNQTKKKMHMRKPPFLEFNCMYMSMDVTKDFKLVEVMNKGRFVHVEDTGYEIRTIRCILTRKQFVVYLWPSRIGCESDEEVKPMVKLSKSHGILEALIHISRTTNICGRKNDPMTEIVKIDVVVSTSNGVL